MTYELPRLEDGSVNFPRVSRWAREGFDKGDDLKLLKLIDANARAEERNRCADFCLNNDHFPSEGEWLGTAIRNLGDE